MSKKKQQQEPPQPNRDKLLEAGYDVFLVMPEFDAAIIGIDVNERVVYDFDKMVECLVDENCDEEMAIDWIEYNTIRSLPYKGDRAPIIMRVRIEDL